MKIKIITFKDMSIFEHTIEDFYSRHKIIDIKFSTSFDKNDNLYHSAMILYEKIIK
jgi:hypothetical protein